MGQLFQIYGKSINLSITLFSRSKHSLAQCNTIVSAYEFNRHLQSYFINSFACWVIFSNICFFQNFQKIHCLHPLFLLIYNLNVKQFGSQMKPHILWGFIWIQIVCKGYQRSSKFTASGLRVKPSIHLSLLIVVFLTLYSQKANFEDT